MGISVAGLAGLFPQHAVNAVRHRGGFVGMAGCALHLRDFCRMRVILNRGMAVIAGENAVKAGCMPGWINEDTLAGEEVMPAGRGMPSSSRLA